MNKSSKTMLFALMVATTPWLIMPVIAAPVTSPLMLRSAVAPSVETVQYRRPAYVAPAPYIGGDAVGYCAQRFRSYDPYSGTYLGYDGLRHPCP